jgi:phosphogluconate dehydratase
VQGNLGRACLQGDSGDLESTDSSSSRFRFQGPAFVFDSEEHFLRAYRDHELERDFVAIVRFQGRRAQGDKRRHLGEAVQALAQLKERGFDVALVTDGRATSGSSGVPVADQLVPEALCNGTLRRLLPGDLVRIDREAGQLLLMVDEQRILSRDPAAPELPTTRQVEAAAPLPARSEKSVERFG